jgi:hypothetical protein
VRWNRPRVRTTWDGRGARAWHLAGGGVLVLWPSMRWPPVGVPTTIALELLHGLHVELAHDECGEFGRNLTGVRSVFAGNGAELSVPRNLKDSMQDRVVS